MPECDSGAATDVGLLRTNNEDAILSQPDIGLWVVADGMGGHEAGEVASDLTQHAIHEAYLKGVTLEQAIYDAHQSILNAVQNGQGKYGMGSTVVALSSAGNHYQIAWVGDSRAYLYKPSIKGTLQQLSTDHSYVQSLFNTGVISREQMATHPDKNIITQCLGSTELDEIKVDYVNHKWHKNERVVLCSDGLTDGVSDAQILETLQLNSNPQDAANALIQAALASGGKDNISVVVIEAPKNLPNHWLAKLKGFFE